MEKKPIAHLLNKFVHIRLLDGTEYYGVLLNDYGDTIKVKIVEDNIRYNSLRQNYFQLLSKTAIEMVYLCPNDLIAYEKEGKINV